MFTRKTLVLIALVLTLPAISLADPVVRSASGASAAAIQGTVDQFRADLGEPNNGNTPGSQPNGRREINWDGGGAAAPAATFGIPMTTFSNRGAVFTTPGTGFEMSGQPSPEFGDINPAYTGTFAAFSSPRLFTALGSNIVDVLFTVPGTTDVPALVSGFGSVFSDVDLANTTSIEFFDAASQSLGIYYAQAVQGNETLSFLGVSFGSAIISRVRITNGNAVLGASTLDGGGIDLVVMDDFLYGEPQAAAVPEPATMLLLGTGLAGVAAKARRRRKSADA